MYEFLFKKHWTEIANEQMKPEMRLALEMRKQSLIHGYRIKYIKIDSRKLDKLFKDTGHRLDKLFGIDVLPI